MAGNTDINRTPPISVRRHLRRESRYQCSFPGCGIPFLEYHHFDPPWSERKHHEHDGMIALCPLHHALADGGGLSKSMLRFYKKNAKSSDVVGRFVWNSNQTIFMGAGHFGFSVPVLLELNGENIIWFTKDDFGFDMLNMKIHDSDGNLLLFMEGNDWIIRQSLVNDVEVKSGGASIKIVGSDKITEIFISIKSLVKDDLISNLNSMINSEIVKSFCESHIVCDGYIFKFNFKIFHPRKIISDSKKMVIDDKISISDSFSAFCQVLISA